MRHTYSLSDLCKAYKGSSSSYHAYMNGDSHRVSQENEKLRVQIRAAHTQMRGTYGADRVHTRVLKASFILLASKICITKRLSAIARLNRKGNCWDNAPMESFRGLLKNELVYHMTFATRAEARKAITEYIELFYNRQRIQAEHGFLSSAMYAAKPRQILARAA